MRLLAPGAIYFGIYNTPSFRNLGVFGIFHLFFVEYQIRFYSKTTFWRTIHNHGLGLS